MRKRLVLTIAAAAAIVGISAGVGGTVAGAFGGHQTVTSNEAGRSRTN